MFEPDTATRVLDACLKEKTGFVRLLEKLVKCETPSGKPQAQRHLFGIMSRELKQIGFEVGLYPGRRSGGQLMARLPEKSGSGYQLLLGHSDTVWPKGTLGKIPWEVDGNILRGPGIYDMKAGLAMMVIALRVLQQQKLVPRLKPVLFINSDEETGSGDSAGRIVRLARVMKRVYVLEPSLDPEGKLKTRRKGVGHFDIRVKGLASHAGIEPEKGKSAIYELSMLIQKLFDMNDPEKGISVNVGRIDGGTTSNVIASESSASVDVRVLTKKDADWLGKQIKSLKPTVKGTTHEIEGGFGRPPLVQNNRNRALWQAAKKVAGRLGINLEEGISGGGSDGSFTSLHTATLDGLGAVGEGAHSPTEKIFLEETLQRCALLGLLLLTPNLSKKGEAERFHRQAENV